MRSTLLIAGAVVLPLLAGRQVLADQASLRRDGGASEKRAAADQVPGEDSPLAEKRAWLRGQMLREFNDVDRRAEIESKVAQMSPERVDALVRLYQRRDDRLRQEIVNEERHRLAQTPGYRDAQIGRYQAARGNGRAVGYAPIITVLPEGTSLGASAVVSPDRRYVRMSLQPFFSRVGPVDTFNFRTGRSQPAYSPYYYQPNVYPPYYAQPTVYPRQDRRRVGIPYYDGVRTRMYYPQASRPR
jgi:hypothetical protein